MEIKGHSHEISRERMSLRYDLSGDGTYTTETQSPPMLIRHCACEKKFIVSTYYSYQSDKESHTLQQHSANHKTGRKSTFILKIVKKFGLFMLCTYKVVTEELFITFLSKTNKHKGKSGTKNSLSEKPIVLDCGGRDQSSLHPLTQHSRQTSPGRVSNTGLCDGWKAITVPKS
jgi:hypothetical protein